MGFKQNVSDQELQDMLVTYGPLVVTTDANQLGSYRSGLFNPAKTCSEINHAVNLVGYVANANPPYYILRNSWGSNWGEVRFRD